MIPRPIVTLVVLVLLAVLAADVGAQLIISGHAASPVIDGAIIALIGAIITGAKGPKPEGPTAPPPTPTAEFPATSVPRAEPGRHHRREGLP